MVVRKKRSVLVFGLIVAGVLCATLAGVPSVSAVEVESDRLNHLVCADLRIALASDDPTGTVLVIVDGAVRAAVPGIPGQTLSLDEVDMPVGEHEVVAAIRTPQGMTTSEALRLAVWEAPTPPILVSPGPYSGATVPVSVRVGIGTTSLALYVDGVLVKERTVAEGSLASMGVASLGAGAHTFELVATNPVAETRASFNVRRLDYPWPTCIVIDKSDFALYWVRDGVLIKTYGIAVGKSGTPTPTRVWRIDAKYHTDPTGVFGPRKMRLFQQTSWGYAYTAYGIHGTNQPWVIGTMASHGCIRLTNENILELFPQVPLGTMVLTRE